MGPQGPSLYIKNSHPTETFTLGGRRTGPLVCVGTFIVRWITGARNVIPLTYEGWITPFCECVSLRTYTHGSF